MKPTATIYQNEDTVYIIFSPDKEGKYRGARSSFENNWNDGGACGLSGFNNKRELNKFIKDNNLEKRGEVELDRYCWSYHTVETYPKKITKTKTINMIHGGSATCMKKEHHKGKHVGYVSAGFNEEMIKVKWD